ncbi:GmrSD restriction endonuclease domain-containing protein [Acinetobacter gyllenbergii]|uniref:GmrSD restriction endonuclease domain-containing protein n=1 Tax=Acinetobacter gyllenbergii TaxID=134534 RepID=UPI0003BFAAFF|nr:DUF262 domain-containing protein [Acinetobacter gyllenbergii]ESK53123.1 hypothetical protein F987_01285 [Acinetobacter gyllenbergii NIPH 230]
MNALQEELSNIDNQNDDEDDLNETNFKNFNLVTTPNDFNALTLITFMDKGVFKIPSFQRNFVWDLQKSSKLIESLIVGLPIPQIFLYERGRNSFEVIDGQQRLLSLYFFFKGRFPKPATKVLLRNKINSSDTEFFKESFLKNDDYFSNFSLKLQSKNNPESENNPLHNKNIHTLDSEYKTTLELSTIRNMIVKPAESVDDEHYAMFEIFNRLNSGGMNLNNQEIRMSLYTSTFLDLLVDLNNNNIWRKVVGKDTLDLRLKDVELILRLFAILICGSEKTPENYDFMKKSLYQNSILAFLNSFANYSKQFSNEQLTRFKSIWEQFMLSINDLDLSILSNSTNYNSNAKVSVPVLEAVFYGVHRSSLNDEINDLIITPKMIIELKSDDKFIKACNDKTTSKTNVHNRLKIAFDFFDSVSN